MGALRYRYGWLDTPLSTRDTDHPVMMKVKNIVEGMGIGLIFDGLAYTLKKGSKEAIDQIINRNKSLKNQTVQAGIAQLRRGEAEFRADKNAPSAQPHQGAHISEVEPQVARDQLSQTRKDYGSEDGSTGSVTTPVERESIAMYGATDEATVERIFRGLVSSEKFAKENFRVAIIDLPGQGLSTRFGNPSTVIHVSDFELYFKAMNFLMKSLKFGLYRKTIFFGHSLGGLLILYYQIQMVFLMDIKLHNLLHIVKLFQKATEAWKEIMNCLLYTSPSPRD